MGISHAKAYAARPDCAIAGVVSRTAASREAFSAALGQEFPGFADVDEALTALRPDAVCISTYPDTHAAFARKALQAAAHVFVEKPLAANLPDARALRDLALASGRQLVVGYILRQHPSWQAFIAEARQLGKPLVMRMNLNQQSDGHEWQLHKNLLSSLSPLVDCGVHYVDVMCQMTRSQPTHVHAIGARLTDEIAPGQYNYGCLQVSFADGSVGWYEAGWGPMMSQEAFFIKDVAGPKGSVSLVAKKIAQESDDIEGHTRTGAMLRHFSETDGAGQLTRSDQIIDTSDEPDHDSLCALEQAHFLRAIRENHDLSDHLNEAVHSLQIVLAADESVRTRKAVTLT